MHRTEQPSIAVYTGEGASHSWTWFADIFERRHISMVAFLDEADIVSGALDGVDVLVRFRRGHLCHCSCAG